MSVEANPEPVNLTVVAPGPESHKNGVLLLNGDVTPVVTGVAAGVGSVDGEGSAAGVGVGAGGGAGGGFTGAVEVDGLVLCDGLGGAVSLPTALRTAATNGSAACGVGTEPVRMVLKSTMRP